MPTPSNWPLTAGAIRFFVPHFLQHQLAHHPLTQTLYLNGFGYYPSAYLHQMTRSHHEDNLILYCTAGKGRLETENQHLQVAPGDVMLLPKGTPHHYQADARSPWTLYWAHFDGANSEHHFQHITNNEKRYWVHVGIHSRLINEFDHLFAARNTGYNLHAFISASHTLGQILTQTASLFALNRGHNTPENLFDAVEKHMESVIDSHLELETLAAMAGMSKYHFSKKYKQVYGYSPIQHFIHRKMERACQLLDTSDMDINAVANAMGYEDAHYFSRLFKKTTGISPKHYRNLGRG